MIELETPTRDEIAGHWKQIRGLIKERWGELTESDLDQIAGKRDQLIGLLQEKYSITRDEASKQLDEFTATYESRREEIKNRDLTIPFDGAEPGKIQAGIAAGVGVVLLALAYYLFRKASGESG